MLTMLRFLLLPIFLISLVYAAKGQFRPVYKKNHAVNKILKQFTTSNDFASAGLAFYAIDLETGEVIAQHNQELVLKPASTQKLITTATLLELCGPAFQFKTILQYSGTLDTIHHILRGDIIIVGGGDPTLGSKYFAETSNGQFLKQWIAAIKNLGIDSITGNVIGNAQIYDADMVPSTWSWQNMGNYFGAGACGLSIYDNSYTLHFKTGNKRGDSTFVKSIWPEIPGLVFDNKVWSDSIPYDNTTIFGAPYLYQRDIRGTLPIQKEDFTVKGSMPDPALTAAQELFRALIKNSVGVGGKATTSRIMQKDGAKILEQGVPIDTLFSPRLDSILSETNTYSINLFAEHCLMQVALELGKPAKIDSAVAAMQTFWQEKGMNTQGMSLNDGSGLSHYNVLSPLQLVFVLQYMNNQSTNSDTFHKSFAICGQSGTLKSLCKNTLAQGNLHAKSGTLSKTKGFAGYVTSKSGRKLAFGVLLNNYKGTNSDATKKLEQLLIALAELDK